MTDATEILTRAERGDPHAADQLLDLTYEELRRCAQRYLSSERPDHTLQPTALVHEAYVKLVRQDERGWQGRTHFLAVASLSMRQVLVDQAVRHRAQKRGGAALRVCLTETNLLVADETGVDLLELDEALTKLKERDEECARIVELRFFGGLDVAEVAEALGISARTVKRRWRFARAWLLDRLNAVS